jgi:hypothetical protein
MLSWAGFHFTVKLRILGTIPLWHEFPYNRERLHETLDYVSPVRYEEQTVVP